MSQALTPVNLSGLTVGQTGKIDLSNIMGGGGINLTPGTKNLPTIRIHNDSGSGLAITLPLSGQSFNLPAGGWQDCNPLPGETEIAFTVVYLLPNPPVTLLLATYYGPNETVPPMTILGNSPIGGGVSSTNAQTVTNTGLPAGTTVLFGLPVLDNDPAGATIVYNSGKILLGDASYTGTLDLIQNGGDSFLLQANGWTQTDSAGVNVSTMSDTGIVSVGNTNHNGAVQITGTTLVGLILNIANGLLITDTTGTTVDQLNTIGQLLLGNANHGGAVKLTNTSGSVDVDIETGSTTINGSTSGTATVWQVFRGTALKLVILKLTNYRNGSAPAQTLTLPTAFTLGYFFYVGNVSPFNCMNSGVAQNVGVITTLAAAGGSVAIQTQLNKYSIGDNTNPFDAINFIGSQAGTYSGFAFFVGI